MDYKEIYSRSYIKKYDPKLFVNKDYAYSKMREWMHEIVSFPYVVSKFRSLTLDDEVEKLSFELINSVNDIDDKEFVIKVFSDGFVICWLREQVDSVLNTAFVIGGKDEKKIQSNYKENIERLNSLEIKHKKLVRDHGYINGTIG